MRKVTLNTVNAFQNNTPYSEGNTSVIVNYKEDDTSLYLHGNLIATKVKGALYITNAGWATLTTKERLNGIDGVSIKQVKGLWYLNGEQWDGSLIKINA